MRYYALENFGDVVDFFFHESREWAFGDEFAALWGFDKLFFDFLAFIEKFDLTRVYDRHVAVVEHVDILGFGKCGWDVGGDERKVFACTYTQGHAVFDADEGVGALQGEGDDGVTAFEVLDCFLGGFL